MDPETALKWVAVATFAAMMIVMLAAGVIALITVISDWRKGQ